MAHLERSNPELVQVLDPIFEGVQIKHFNENGTIDANTPMDLVINDEVPVDAEHVAELAADMREKARDMEIIGQEKATGQLTAVFLGQVPGEKAFPIIDGFHRTAVLRQVNAELVDSRIKPAITWEEVYDQRILAAASHKGVKFARVVEWIEAVWQLSPWGEQISALQAFGIVTQPTMTGENLGISKKDVPSIKQWAQDHCRAWGGISPNSVFNDLRAAQNVDPGLLKEARLNGSKGVISPAHLRTLGALLPNNFDQQRLVAEIIKEHDLTASEVKTLTALVSAIGVGPKLDKVIDTKAWQLVEPPSRPIGRPSTDISSRKERKSPAEQMDYIRHELISSEIETCLLAIQNIIFRARYIAPPIGSRLDPRVPEIKGIHAPNIVMTPPDITTFESHMELMRQEALNRLASRVGKEKATDIVQTVIDRITDDTRKGALRFGVVDSKQQMSKLFSATLNAELKTSMSPSDTVSAPAVESSVPRLSLVSLRIEEMLADLTAFERRALILGSVFELANFTIAQLTEVTPVEVDDMFSELYKDLKTVTKTQESPSTRSTVRRHGDKIDVSIDDDITNPYGLTTSELPIALLISFGFSNREIARARLISEETVKSHVRHMLTKTDARSRSELVSLMHRTGTMQGIRVQEPETQKA